MRSSFASRTLAAVGLVFAFGIGCGSTGGGCGGGLKPLPAQPGPLGLPTSQVIEGGIQARIAKSGMDKMTAVIANLFRTSLGPGFCVGQQNVVNDPSNGIHLVACDTTACSGAATGCPASVILNSANRGAPANFDDGLDKIAVSVPDSTTPQITIDAFFDYHFPLLLDYSVQILGIGPSGTCTTDIYDQHYVDSGNPPAASPVNIKATVDLGIDPVTGELTITLSSFQILNLDLRANGCGFIGTLLNGIGSAFSSFIGSGLGQFIINNILTPLLLPTLNTLVNSFLPKPPGMAGTVDGHALLAKYHAPTNSNLETFLVAGGYVETKAGGLTLGVMSGMNSDRDQTTRTTGMASEASLCVPIRPVPALAMPPWKLPFNAARNDFVLAPANEFSGNPDPMVMGVPQDVAIGVSRTFLDLSGFHLYNSGMLCLAIGGDVLPQLNAGTLSIIIQSLGNILESKKAPLALVLRPQTPLTFTLGAGSMTDPLIHVNVSDMRIDFYAWIEERYVRLMTLGLDTSVGVNLTITKTPAGKPAIQPTLVGVNASNIKIRITNSDLLAEDPKTLEAVFPSLINIATGALGSSVKAFPLPAVSGFSLDNLSIRRVQTTQDDFIGIFASIVTGAGAPLIDWTDPDHPHIVGELDTHAVVTEVKVPKPEQIRGLFAAENDLTRLAGARPQVTLDLAADRAGGKPVEYGWRIDGSMWHPYTTDPHLVLADDLFLLQGRHTIEVRSRIVNEWSTEDSTPAAVEVLIDSVPPTLKPAVEGDRLVFHGDDIVSDKLEYAWLDDHGLKSDWTTEGSMPLGQAKNLAALAPLTLLARDEAGNVGRVQLGAGDLGFHGRTTNPPAAGCGCELGGANRNVPRGVWLLGLALALVVVSRRRRTLGAASLVVAFGLYASGCSCSSNAAYCKLDDECLKMKCPNGQLAACLQNACACSPDVPLGDVGRFSSMVTLNGEAYVSAYNNTYGDLMIGRVQPPGVVTDWDFVDGVPDQPADVPASHVRGGITEPGDDVGRYTSIQVTGGDPVIAYYDITHHALKFASFGAIRWHSHFVDRGVGRDDVGRWTSLVVDAQGRPGIAYTVTTYTLTQTGMPEGQLRFAKAKVARPQSPGDWTVTVVDSRPLPAPAAIPDGGAPPGEPLLPEGIGLMPSASIGSDGRIGIVYYDRTRGNLRFAESDASGRFGAPILLDGELPNGTDTGDVGLYPSLAYAGTTAHISYVDATRDALLYVNTQTKTPEVADDGYRSKDETTQDGLPSPVFHLVGDSSSIQTASGRIAIAYQDSTSIQLRFAVRQPTGKWLSKVVAGHASPFAGSYGFYASMRASGSLAVISTYAINQMAMSRVFYVETFAVDLGLIM